MNLDALEALGSEVCVEGALPHVDELEVTSDRLGQLWGGAAAVSHVRRRGTHRAVHRVVTMRSGECGARCRARYAALRGALCGRTVQRRRCTTRHPRAVHRVPQARTVHGARCTALPA